MSQSAASWLCSERSLALCYCVVLHALPVVLVAVYWMYVLRQLIWSCATTVAHWTHSMNSVTIPAAIFLAPVWHLLCYIITLLWKYRITVSFCYFVILSIAISLQHHMTHRFFLLHLPHFSGQIISVCELCQYMQKEGHCILVSPHWVCGYTLNFSHANPYLRFSIVAQ